MQINDEFYYSGDAANGECKMTVRDISEPIITLTDEAGNERKVFAYEMQAPRFQPFQEWRQSRQESIARAYGL